MECFDFDKTLTVHSRRNAAKLRESSYCHASPYLRGKNQWGLHQNEALTFFHMSLISLVCVKNVNSF